MRFSASLLVAGAFYSAACAEDNSFQEPTATDRRSPCPMVNAVANHGFIARDGLNISMQDLITGFNNSVHLASAATQLVGAKALLASTTNTNFTTFNLDDLSRHGFIEHDASLSRADTFSGDNHSFNSTIWEGTRSHFTNDTISLAQAAAARKDRIALAPASNPDFNMTASDVQFSAIETALYLTVFADNSTEARLEWVRVFFEQHRLPYAEGWARSETELTTAMILAKTAGVLSA